MRIPKVLTTATYKVLDDNAIFTGMPVTPGGTNAGAGPAQGSGFLLSQNEAIGLAAVFAILLVAVLKLMFCAAGKKRDPERRVERYIEECGGVCFAANWVIAASGFLEGK